MVASFPVLHRCSCPTPSRPTRTPALPSTRPHPQLRRGSRHGPPTLTSRRRPTRGSRARARRGASAMPTANPRRRRGSLPRDHRSRRRRSFSTPEYPGSTPRVPCTGPLPAACRSEFGRKLMVAFHRFPLGVRTQRRAVLSYLTFYYIRACCVGCIGGIPGMDSVS